MFYREDDQPVGVLCDWDLAELKVNDEKHAEEGQYSHYLTKTVNTTVPGNESADNIIIEDHADQSKAPPRPQYRTGTGPFMALDLLNEGEVPPYQYRFDLESFFYVLVWFCAVFDPTTNRFKHLKNWESSNLLSIGDAKRKFLLNSVCYKNTFAQGHPDYQILVKRWVWKLAKLFQEVNITCWYPLELEQNRLDHEEMDHEERQEVISEIKSILEKKGDNRHVRKVHALHSSSAIVPFCLLFSILFIVGTSWDITLRIKSCSIANYFFCFSLAQRTSNTTAL